VNCPRGIEIIDVIKSVRGLNVTAGRIPESFQAPLDSLKANGNPWDGVRTKRLEWAGDLDLPAFTPEHEYCLFTCCTTAYDPGNRIAGQALLQLLEYAGIDKDVILSAYNDRVEVWAKDQYDLMLDNEPEDFSDLAEEVLGKSNSNPE